MPRRLVSGLTLVVAGVLLLMNTTGYLPWSVWTAAATYWPVLVIGLGLQVVFERSEIPIFPLAVVIVMILGAMHPLLPRSSNLKRSPSRGIGESYYQTPLQDTKEWSVPLGSSVSRLEAKFRAPSLDLDIKGNPGLNDRTASSALFANLTWDRSEPVTESWEQRGVAYVSIEGPEEIGANVGRQVWLVELNPSLSNSIDITCGVANVSLDCASALVGDVDIAAGVVAFKMKAGLSGEETVVNISGGVADLDIVVPRSAGVHISISSPLTITHDLGQEGLVRSGNVWSTSNYDSASTKIRVTLASGAGRVSLQRTD